MLKEKIIILGGTSGIGLETAKLFLEKDYEVVIGSRDPNKLKEAKEKLSNVEAIEVDGSDEKSIQAFFEKIGKFNHLVTTLGSHYFSPVENSSSEEFKKLIDSKQFAQYLAVKHGSKNISKNGSITLFRGTVTGKPLLGSSFYASVGAASEAAGRVYALELAPVRVNTIVPGFVRTSAWSKLIPDEQARENQLSQVASVLPVGRIGDVKDISMSVLFLVENTFVTGTSLVVDGGHRLI